MDSVGGIVLIIIIIIIIIIIEMWELLKKHVILLRDLSGRLILFHHNVLIGEWVPNWFQSQIVS